MATIIIHGTMTSSRADKAGFWWWHEDSGFCRALSEGLLKAGDTADVWHVDGIDVSAHAGIPAEQNSPFLVRHGRFLWTGLNQPELRRIAGKELALYLNLIRKTAPAEPIRIVAHSHGCNVVKIASAHRALDSNVFIGSAVFLACPHFQAKGLGFRGDIPYRLEPSRFGRILNLYSSQDSVQVGIAKSLPSLWGGGLFEWSPKAHRIDPDPRAQHIYENYQVTTGDSGIDAHTAMHAEEIGYMAGLWIGDPDYFAAAASGTKLLSAAREQDGG